MSFGDRVVNYISMAIGATVGITVGWIIYKRTMTRAAELAREDNEAATAEEEGRATPYLDTEDTLMDPEDAAALMSDDDMSLWETQVDEGAVERRGDSDGEWDGAKKKTGQNGEGDNGTHGSSW